MTTSLKSWSTYADVKSGPLDEADKAYFREATRGAAYSRVLERFLELSEAGLMTKADLARKLGVSPALVTRRLSSPGNWNLDTLSDLLLAMGSEPHIEARTLANQQQGNYMHYSKRDDGAATESSGSYTAQSSENYSPTKATAEAA